MRKRKKKTWLGSTLLLVLGLLVLYVSFKHPKATQLTHLPFHEIRDLEDFIYKFPKRSDLKFQAQSNRVFDLVIIGGGAIGSGSCYEAITSGFKVACLDSGDWASQTSSRSTKLLHGGVRYMEQCITQFDLSACRLVTDALKERRAVMNLAPHLTGQVNLMTPIYDSYFRLAYVWAGLKIYDWLATILEYASFKSSGLASSEYVSAKDMAERYPFIKQENLTGGVRYTDGNFNDSRLALSLQLSAIKLGAVSLNYTKVIGFEKKAGRIQAVTVEDQITGEQWQMTGKSFINATGPFADEIRQLDDPTATRRTVTSSGVHIALPPKALKILPDEGFLIPETPLYNGKKMGSIGFILPFEGEIIVGTTDQKEPYNHERQPNKDEVQYLLNVANHILEPSGQYTPSDVQSEWIGYRTLVSEGSSFDSQSLSREHQVETAKSGLISVLGGKWTVFRAISREVIQEATKDFPGIGSKKSEKKKAILANLKLHGAVGYSPEFVKDLENSYQINPDIAQHLAHNYGSMAIKVLDIALEKNLFERMDAQHPYIWAEVIYATRYEYALTPFDVMERRIRLDFINKTLSERVFTRVTYLMSQELQTDESWRQKQWTEYTKQRSNT